MSPQIKWENRLKKNNRSICKISVDGTDFKISNPTKQFWKGWYSHKFNAAALRYEVGVGIQTGDIVWVNGPFPAGAFVDITIFRRALKLVLLREGERAEADDGYRGEPLVIELPKEGCYDNEDDAQSKLKKRIRSRHEGINKLFKEFRCLNQKFRHKLNRHKLCFDAVVVLVQIAIRSNQTFVFQIRNYQTQTL